MTDIQVMQHRRIIEFLKDERAQGLLEYALIVALISVVAIAGLTLLGQRSNNTIKTVGNKLP